MISMTSAPLDHGPDGQPARFLKLADRGRLEAGRDLLGIGQFGFRHVVFEQRITAGDDDAFQPAYYTVSQMCVLSCVVLNEHGFVAAEFIEHREPIGGQCATGFHKVHNRVGDAECDHDFNRAGQLHNVGRNAVPVKILLRDVRKAGGDAAIGQIGRLADLAFVGHAHRQPPIAHAEREACGEIDAGFVDEVAASDPHIDRAFGTQHGDIIGSQERDFDGHIANAREQAAILPAKLQPRFDEQLRSHFGQSAFAGDADAEIGGHGGENAGCGEDWRLKI